MPERSFLAEMLQRIAGRGGRKSSKKPADLCSELLGDKGEVSGLVTAMNILDAYEAMTPDQKTLFFQDIAAGFSVDDKALEFAIAGWTPGNDAAAREIHMAAEPKSQELIRRLNRVPGATARLVNMRADLLVALMENPGLNGLNIDFQHLFRSWFNLGFLEMRRMNWSTQADILEKIIAYEAVHEITGWDDLRQRVATPDRRLFAFFHPAMPSDPLIFVEVALTTGVPGAIGPILAKNRKSVDPHSARTAVFYSISNCQSGLRGISFGNFLIKQVVTDLEHEFPSLRQFVTLSPVPGLRRWISDMASDRTADLPPPLAKAVQDAKSTGKIPDEADLPELTARYLLLARRSGNTALDSVAHFHLGNGATLHQINIGADSSPRGIENSWGVMVNYLYHGGSIEANHQAYATEQKIAAAADIRVLAGLPKRP